MKLGNGKNKYVYTFIYKDKGRIARKNVYADNKFDAMYLFLDCYKDMKIILLEVKEIVRREENK